MVELNITKELNMTRGECLRRLRKHEGLSLRQAAKLAGISFGQLSELERGKHRISLDHAHALMELYGGSVKLLARFPHERD
jgi:transcriptional regulator with XRE-family HTH domain